MSWTVLDDHKPTARKQHRCSTCGRFIEPGEQYRRLRIITDDGPDVWKECAHCAALLAAISARDKWAFYDDEGIDAGEYIREYAHGTALHEQWNKAWRGIAVADIAVGCLPDDRAESAPR